MRVDVDITFNDDGTAWWVPEFQDTAQMADWRRQVDQPCPPCDGTGKHYTDDPTDFDYQPHCQMCDGTGRHTFEIEVDEVDSAFAWKPADVWKFRVSVAPGMVLPILDYEDWASSGESEWPHCIVLGTDGHVIEMTMTCVGEGWGEDVERFPPAARPGMWAVKLKVAV